jgi:Ca2+-binding EF-hand superfamily protein
MTTGSWCATVLAQVRPALALFMALRDEQEDIDAKFEKYDRDKTGDLSFDQLSALLCALDDGQ